MRAVVSFARSVIKDVSGKSTVGGSRIGRHFLPHRTRLSAERSCRLTLLLSNRIAVSLQP
jgi:hypothetical protein